MVALASCTGGVGQAEPRGAQPHLVDRLLAADIDAPRGPGRQRRRRACSSSVDLPMPGSPPIRIAEPARGRRPAPGRARRCRWAARGGGAALAVERDELEPPAARLAAGGRRRGLGAASSTMLFQAPQASQRPAQFGVGGAAALADDRRAAAWPSGSPIAMPAPIWIGPSARPWMNWST